MNSLQFVSWTKFRFSNLGTILSFKADQADFSKHVTGTPLNTHEYTLDLGDWILTISNQMLSFIFTHCIVALRVISREHLWSPDALQRACKTIQHGHDLTRLKGIWHGQTWLHLFVDSEAYYKQMGPIPSSNGSLDIALSNGHT